MNPGLTNLLASLTSQPLSKRPAPHPSARDAGGLASSREDKARPQEFSLPPEPRDKDASMQRSRSSDRPPQTRDSQSSREWAPRRDDPPRRSDPPRGGERADEGERSGRSDPPRALDRAVDGAPPRREDPPGLTKADEATSGEADGLENGTTEGAVLEGETGMVSGAAAETSTDGGAIAGKLIDPGLQIAPALPMTSGSDAAPVSGQPNQASESDVDRVDLSVETVVSTAQAQAPEEQVAEAHSAPTQGSEVQTTQGAEVRKGEALENEEDAGDESTVSAAETVTTDPTLAEAATVTTSAAEVGSAAPVLASAGPEGHRAQLASSGASAATEGLNAISAKGTAGVAPQQEQDSLRSQAELMRQETTRSDATTGSRAETLPGDGSTGAKAAAKPDQLLSAGLEAPSAASQPGSSGTASAGSSSNAQAQNASVRVVSEVPLAAVPIEIGLKSLAGVNHFEIRLDPAELGRIEVRLEIDQDGAVKAHLTVDKVETLALLQRDSRTLERAFEQAGLKSTDGSVDMSLRDQQTQNQGGREQGGDQRREGSRLPGSDGRAEAGEAAPVTPPPRRLWGGVAGVDVRI